MIPPEQEIEPNMLVKRHDGPLCLVEDLRPNVTKSTASGEVSEAMTVNYIWLENGYRPAGSPESRDEANFRTNFDVLLPPSSPTAEPQPTPLPLTKRQQRIFEILSGRYRNHGPLQSHELLLLTTIIKRGAL